MQTDLTGIFSPSAVLPAPATDCLPVSIYGAGMRVDEIAGPANHGLTLRLPPSSAYVFQLRLRECARCDMFADGRFSRKAGLNRAGVLDIHDLAMSPQADLQDPFNLLLFSVPRHVIAECLYDMGGPLDGELKISTGASTDDAVARNLFMSLRSALATPLGRNRLFMEHVFAALLAHLSGRYGNPARTKKSAAPRLSAVQVKRVHDLIEGSLGDDLALDALAAAVGLSLRQTSRAFEATFNMPPLRYLMHCRVRKARTLLVNPALRQIDIAVECGFSTQSHFGRVFKTFSGQTPGQWRLANTARFFEQ